MICMFLDRLRRKNKSDVKPKKERTTCYKVFNYDTTGQLVDYNTTERLEYLLNYIKREYDKPTFIVKDNGLLIVEYRG